MVFKKVLAFADFLNAFRKIERVIYVNGADRQENDIEHSYMLAMLAWYIIEVDRLSLNLNKVIKYCLVHDLVETYAGDTYIFSQDKKYVENKEKREKQALLKIKKQFKDFPSIPALVHAYELRKDKESKFVYALDKVQPVINIYLDGGRTWKKHAVVLEMLQEKKDHKVALSPPVQKYWNDLVLLLKADRKRLFGEKK